MNLFNWERKGIIKCSYFSSFDSFSRVTREFSDSLSSDVTTLQGSRGDPTREFHVGHTL